jgi:adenylate cyclase
MDSIDYNLTKQHFSTRIYHSYFNFLSTNYPSINLSELCLRAGLPLEYVRNSDGWVSIEFNYRLMCEVRKTVHDVNFEYKVGASSFSKEIMGSVYYLMKNVMSLAAVYDNLWKLTKYFNKVVTFKSVERSRGKRVIEVQIVEEGLSEQDIHFLKMSMDGIINNSIGFYSGFSKAKGIDSTNVYSVKFSDSKYHIVIKFPLESFVFLGQFLFPASVFIVAGCISYLFSYGLLDCFFFSLVCCMLSFIYGIKRNADELVDAVNLSRDNLNKLDGQYKNLVDTKISLQRKLLEAQAINELTNTLIQSSNEENLLKRAADSLTNVLDFDRVVIMIADARQQYLNVSAISVQEPKLGGVLENFRLEIDIKSDDPSKVSNIYRSGKSILVKDVSAHIATLNVESQMVLSATKSTAFIGVPIRSGNETYGVLLADTFYSNRGLSEEDCQILEIAGRQISIALEKQRAKEDVEKLANSYSRFVPFETIKLLGFSGVQDIKMGQGIELNLTVVFCDIRGFTSISEYMSPSETMFFLNSYFEHVAPIFTKNNGIIDKFMGDGIMALFVNKEDALRAASQFQTTLKEYNRSNKKTVKVGMGVHCGKVLLGAIGYEDRMTISVVSDTVNLTSRLDGLTKKFGVDILCTDDIYMNVNDKKDFRLIAQLNVRGRKGVTNVYEFFGFASDDEKRIKLGNSSLIERFAAGTNDELQAREEAILAHKPDPVLDYYLRNKVS